MNNNTIEVTKPYKIETLEGYVEARLCKTLDQFKGENKQ
jgi:hypothetical protein